MVDVRRVVCLTAHSSRGCRAFNTNLAIKGHNGVLKFSHEQQTVEMVVNVDSYARSSMTQTQAAAGTTDVNTLSGGERSFTTLVRGCRCCCVLCRLSFLTSLSVCLSVCLCARVCVPVCVCLPPPSLSLSLSVSCVSVSAVPPQRHG